MRAAVQVEVIGDCPSSEAAVKQPLPPVSGFRDRARPLASEHPIPNRPIAPRTSRVLKHGSILSEARTRRGQRGKLILMDER